MVFKIGKIDNIAKTKLINVVVASVNSYHFAPHFKSS